MHLYGFVYLFELLSFIVGINESVQMAIYQILASILHLSNVEVKDQSGDRSSILVNTLLCLLV